MPAPAPADHRSRLRPSKVTRLTTPTDRKRRVSRAWANNVTYRPGPVLTIVSSQNLMTFGWNAQGSQKPHGPVTRLASRVPHAAPGLRSPTILGGARSTALPLAPG